MAYRVEDSVKKSIYVDLLAIAQSEPGWSSLRGSTVLVTGAGGFIGYYLCASLLLRNDLYDDNIRVIGLVRNEAKAREKYDSLLLREDISLCVQDVSRPIQADKADYVIHAASQASNIQFENDPVGTINANLLGTASVLNYAKACEAKATLVVSSLKIYGLIYGNQKKIKETDSGYLDITSYKNCYAMGKRAAETLAASYCREYGMHVKIARPAYIYGAASLDDDRVWAQFIANIVKKQDILLKSDGSAYRSFCYVADTVSALLYILLNGEDMKPYNISNENSDVTIRDFAKAACRVFPERRISLRFQNPAHEKEPERVVSPIETVPEILDNTALLSIGWKPRVDLSEGIRRAVAVLEET